MSKPIQTKHKAKNTQLAELEMKKISTVETKGPQRLIREQFENLHSSKAEKSRGSQIPRGYKWPRQTYSKGTKAVIVSQ